MNTYQELCQFCINELKPISDSSNITILTNYILKYFGISKFSIDLTEKETQNIKSKISETCAQLAIGKPIQYVLNETQFMDLKLKINESVLIPRPETEELVYYALQSIKDYKTKKLNILDIGTGSGCIPLMWKFKRPQDEVFAIDISEPALNLAQENAKNHKLDIHFLKLDILNQQFNLDSFDLILSNPPYISPNEKHLMDQSVLNYEPHIALFANHPLQFYERIKLLMDKGSKANVIGFFELNEFFAKEIDSIFTPDYSTAMIKDLQQKDRILKVTK